MGRDGDLDYVFLTKAGFYFGLGLFVTGGGGALLGYAYLGMLPALVERILFDLEVIGLVIGFFSR